MPTEAEKLSIAKASIQASTKGDEPLAHLLRNVADGMFGPEPKGVSIEHWALIHRNACEAANKAIRKFAKDQGNNEPPKANSDPQA